ncbi:MAG: hypothetical protein GC162_20425 [Planctomycetes bacterium]|nr:hypothetical protein [Planctomycetota bacterium]
MKDQSYPWLSEWSYRPHELKVLDDLLFPNAHVLEWGCGESTMWLAARVGKLVAVESKADWYERCCRNKPANVTIHLAQSWDEYVFKPVLDAPYDIILIDGEHRVACAQAVVDHGYLKQGGYVVLHDKDRMEYAAIYDLFDVVRSTPSEGDKRAPHKGLAIMQARGD